MSTNSKNQNTFSEVTPEHREKESKQKDMLQFSSKPITCCVSVIDIVNSTKITAQISESKIGLYYSIFLNHVSNIINDHGGNVVKNIGDSLLYYFVNQNESYESIVNSFRCNLNIVKKRDEINKKLEVESLPKVSYRISSDYGKVLMAKSQISLTADIFGSTVNMCTKINHVGKANEFFVGSDLYLNAKNLDEFNFEEINANHLSIFKNTYPVYYVKKAG